MTTNLIPHESLTAIQRLVVAIIDLAVIDYKHYVRRGVIIDGVAVKSGKILTGKHLNAERGLNRHNDASSLIKFFNGGLDFYITWAKIDISPDAIRAKLQSYTPTTARHNRALGKFEIIDTPHDY